MARAAAAVDDIVPAVVLSLRDDVIPQLFYKVTQVVANLSWWT